MHTKTQVSLPGTDTLPHLPPEIGEFTVQDMTEALLQSLKVEILEKIESLENERKSRIKIMPLKIQDGIPANFLILSGRNQLQLRIAENQLMVHLTTFVDFECKQTEVICAQPCIDGSGQTLWRKRDLHYVTETMLVEMLITTL